VRFSKILGRLKTHTEYFEQNLGLENASIMMSHYKLVEKEIEENVRFREEHGNEVRQKENDAMGAIFPPETYHKLTASSSKNAKSPSLDRCP
jgi:hypothetical protein